MWEHARSDSESRVELFSPGVGVFEAFKDALDNRSFDPYAIASHFPNKDQWRRLPVHLHNWLSKVEQRENESINLQRQFLFAILDDVSSCLLSGEKKPSRKETQTLDEYIKAIFDSVDASDQLWNSFKATNENRFLDTSEVPIFWGDYAKALISIRDAPPLIRPLELDTFRIMLDIENGVAAEGGNRKSIGRLHTSSLKYISDAEPRIRVLLSEIAGTDLSDSNVAHLFDNSFAPTEQFTERLSGKWAIQAFEAEFDSFMGDPTNLYHLDNGMDLLFHPAICKPFGASILDFIIAFNDRGEDAGARQPAIILSGLVSPNLLNWLRGPSLAEDGPCRHLNLSYHFEPFQDAHVVVPLYRGRASKQERFFYCSPRLNPFEAEIRALVHSGKIERLLGILCEELPPIDLQTASPQLLLERRNVINNELRILLENASRSLRLPGWSSVTGAFSEEELKSAVSEAVKLFNRNRKNAEWLALEKASEQKIMETTRNIVGRVGEIESRKLASAGFQERDEERRARGYSGPKEGIALPLVAVAFDVLKALEKGIEDPYAKIERIPNIEALNLHANNLPSQRHIRVTVHDGEDGSYVVHEKHVQSDAEAYPFMARIEVPLLRENYRRLKGRLEYVRKKRPSLDWLMNQLPSYFNIDSLEQVKKPRVTDESQKEIKKASSDLKRDFRKLHQLGVPILSKFMKKLSDEELDSAVSDEHRKFLTESLKEHWEYREKNLYEALISIEHGKEKLLSGELERGVRATLLHRIKRAMGNDNFSESFRKLDSNAQTSFRRALRTEITGMWGLLGIFKLLERPLLMEVVSIEDIEAIKYIYTSRDDEVEGTVLSYNFEPEGRTAAPGMKLSRPSHGETNGWESSFCAGEELFVRRDFHGFSFSTWENESRWIDKNRKGFVFRDLNGASGHFHPDFHQSMDLALSLTTEDLIKLEELCLRRGEEPFLIFDPAVPPRKLDAFRMTSLA